MANNKKPALILGGSANTISITRSLSRLGVPVSISAKSDCAAFQSRFCKKKYLVTDENDPLGYWENLLIKNKDSDLEGSVILACSDDAVEFLAKQRSALEKDYVLDHFDPELQLKMLDKQTTLELAKSLDIPVPKFWNIDSIEDITSIKDEIMYPVIIKPINSHIFQRYYNGKKYLLIESYHDLVEQIILAFEKGLKVMLCEKIPGPDTLLSSYYTYIDDNGDPFFAYTKQILRRYPKNIGGASYHITKHNKETEELGKRFFSGIDYRGLGNIEFKRDLRDGKLKVIECNPRFTAAQELLVKSGIDTGAMIYRHLTGESVPRFPAIKNDVRLLNLHHDYKAYRDLRARGELSFPGWLKSLAHWQTFDYFELTDPWPATSRLLDIPKNKIRKLFK